MAHFKKKALIAAIGIIVIAGVLIYAYRPTAALERSLENLAEAQTADFSTQLKLENSVSTKELLGEEGTVDIAIDGQWQRADGPDTLLTNVSLTTQTESVSITIQGKIYLIADKLYLLIEKTPQAFPPLVQLKDRWIVMDRGATEENDTALNINADMFTAVDRQGVEDIGDTTTVRYRAVATDDAIIRLMDGLAGVLGTSLSETQIDQIRQSVAQVETIPMDFWVKRWGSELKQLRTTLAVPGGNTVQLTLRLNQLNQPVTVTAPTDAKPIQEL